MNAGCPSIIFDVFGVLLSSSFRSGARALEALLKRPAAIIEPIYTRWEYPWDRGEITGAEFWAHVQSALGTDVDWRLLDAAVLNNIRPLPGSLSLLDRCTAQINTFLLSDTRQEWFNTLDGRYGLRRRVKRAFLSYEMGFGKAEPRCFQHVLAELRVPATTICLIDDRGENQEMARRFDMKAIRFQDARQAETDLARLFPGILRRAGAESS